MKEQTTRLGILVTHPIQYFAPLFRELATAPEVDLTVLYRTRKGVEGYHDPGFGRSLKWDVPLLDGYPHIFLSRRTDVAGVQWQILRHLIHRRFDALVIHGYASLTNLLAIVTCKLVGTRVLMRGDTRLQSRHQSESGRAWLKRVIFRLCDGFLAIGSLNREYYLAHGVPLERIHQVPFSVRNAQFSLSADVVATHRAALRKTLGARPDALLVLFAAKIVAQKRPADAVDAFARIQGDFPDAWLVFAGSGEKEPELRDRIAALEMEHVRFLGFLNQSELPAAYAAADVFVLPAEIEAWGLVVNEVMAAGLPVIVSDQVGAAVDLVEGRGTGIVFPCGDVTQLESALRSVLGDPVKRLAMANHARELIKDWDVARTAEAMICAVSAVLQRRGRTTK